MRVLVADDHPLYREALCARLQSMFSDIEIVEVASIEEFKRTRSSETFSLLLLDYLMPGMSGEAIQELVVEYPDTPVAVISGTLDNADIRKVVKCGARGFIPKAASGNHLLNAIQILLAGGTSIPVAALVEDAVPDKSKSAPWLSSLTTREVEVLRFLALGLSNKEIGLKLELAEITIKLHFRSIFRKIGARNRSEAAVMASKANI